MTIKKIQRRYPENNWDYKATSTIINDAGTKRDVIYYKLINNSKASEGVEVYSGSNYISGSKDKSSSRSYPISNFPAKYKDVVEKLKAEHKSSKWSSAKRVDSN
jgi:hypothetical protein